MKHRRGRALRRRYGRSSHPLFPRLVMYLNKDVTGKVPTYTITGKLQSHYGGPWQTVFTSPPSWEVSKARTYLRSRGQQVAAEHGVPASHVEYVT